MYSFASQQREWLQLPVDDVGYISANKLLTLDDPAFDAYMAIAQNNRYNLGQWRNYENKWRDYLGLDTTKGKTIIDFGCGVGLEAKQFAAKNEIILADINQESINVAKRLLDKDVATCLISEEYPYFECQPYDIFYANGVLHHTPMFREILQRAVELLKPKGEIRLMLYSDIGWKLAGQNPIRYFDDVGNYADWYSRKKLEDEVGDFLDIFFCEYITPNKSYLVTKMRSKQ